ncbi:MULTISPECIES: hypothetical protein [Nostocales]|uniref:Uncharacterized protein n=1 Tax=Dolichospermum flos-aquae UHCC 0037 TaxID=2590026 RepID=A0ACC7S7C4_DOLFA|nr:MULTISPECIES: hypothetical protein [Nostocales]MBO1064665.1 hypothetical protein [Anabaena sp. 54]MTJ44096.1 hypothetical protein [Dolichospermum flos-aquae UHCC 0037]
MAIYNLPVLFCSVFLLYFLTFFLDFKFFLNDRLTIKTVATINVVLRKGSGRAKINNSIKLPPLPITHYPLPNPKACGFV